MLLTYATLLTYASRTFGTGPRSDLFFYNSLTDLQKNFTFFFYYVSRSALCILEEHSETLGIHTTHIIPCGTV